MKPRLAIIELNKFHSECIPSMVSYLKGSYEVHVLCIDKLQTELQHTEFKEVQYNYFDISSSLKKQIVLFKIYKHLITHGFSKVIFNTIGKSNTKLILLPFPKSVEKVGIEHNFHSIKKRKKTRILAKKIDKYLVLNDYILENIKKEDLTNKPIASLYPLLLAQPKHKTIRKQTGEIWITIPGGFDTNKRDYKCLSSITIPKNYSIIILGKTPNTENEWLTHLNHKNKGKIVYFNEYVSNDIYTEYIQLSDFILPLIHDNTLNFRNFLSYKVSGSFLLAFAHRKTLLSVDDFSICDDISENSLFYNPKKINSIFESLLESKDDTYSSDKWIINTQKDKICSFIKQKA